MKLWSQISPLAGALGVSVLSSVAFFIYGAVFRHGSGYWYLMWNLVLAGLPLVFAVWLTKLLDSKRLAWSSWRGIGLSLLWLAFLPNSFYMVTDYIHLQDSSTGSLLYLSVMFTSFIINGLILGYASVYLIHEQLLKRMPRGQAMRFLALVFALCSFGVYLGRDLRWSTWDVLLKPGGLLFDTSEHILSPSTYPDMLLTSAMFFVLITCFYYVLRRLLDGTPYIDRP